MKKLCFLCVATIFLCFPVVSLSQQPAPKINPNPLTRPQYLVVVSSSDVKELMKTIFDTITQAGFKIDHLDSKELQLEAIRPDHPPSKDYDKVLLWLERDFQEPLRYVRIYLLYGRYEEIWGKVSRVEVSPSWEEDRIGGLKQSLISLFNSK